MSFPEIKVSVYIPFEIVHWPDIEFSPLEVNIGGFVAENMWSNISLFRDCLIRGNFVKDTCQRREFDNAARGIRHNLPATRYKVIRFHIFLLFCRSAFLTSRNKIILGIKVTYHFPPTSSNTRSVPNLIESNVTRL